MDDLNINEQLVLPAAELSWRFDPSGGPGGQHANKSATRVELSFDISASPVLDDEVRHRLLANLSHEDGVLKVQVGESRSQWRNRQMARRRLADEINEALKPLPPRRRATRPTRASKERRLAGKRARAETKRLRQKPRHLD